MENRSAARRTKNAIADAFQQLVRDTPTNQVNKISIRKISDMAGISKQTFYNYFFDRQDLIMWTYTRNFEDRTIELVGYTAWAEKSSRVFQNDETYYLKIIKTTEFLQWVENWLGSSIDTYILNHFGHPLSDTEHHTLDIWLHGIVGTTWNDIKKGKSISWGIRSEMDINHMPESLKKYFTQTDGGR